MKKTLPIIIVVLFVAVFGVAWSLTRGDVHEPMATNFQECVAAGNPVMESYPRQCNDGAQSFTEDIGNELEKTDLIRIEYPRPNQTITSPLVITGEARGNWYFEASFPVVLTNWDGLIIAQGIATAKSNWMTADFVPFEAKLTFTVDNNTYSNRGSLILKKDNPSGLPEHDDALEIPVIFAGVTPPTESSCLKDADCPSSKYTCVETQGSGTACSSTDPTCVPTHTVIAGECKLKVGNQCTANSQCAQGNLCHKGICTSPIGRECRGASDTSCPTDFECVQGCGPPVAHEDDPPPPYFCQLKGYVRPCPICLAKNTLIDTAFGMVKVQDVKVGMPVWSETQDGRRILVPVVKISKTIVPADHKVVDFVLDDGRRLQVSPLHLTVDGRTIGDLTRGDKYDGSLVISALRVPYAEEYTYDLLPSGLTGFYFANALPAQAGILLDSTLQP